ncbi:hypothetical protein SALBM217S_02340 [Streptomyces griseoloalbus]|uniref:Uncharacterized protein n=1 Tax=Streptomyces pseudogriseolus TaxID=36817 RepID=A0ABQ2TRT6_STREZ|nr:hypothetical protein [Streptomyces rubiginosus]GGS78283.1 hypothetical protein GCM10010285_65510 [Streptomyces rubiginosus]
MAVNITPTGPGRAEITWTDDDDPQGYLARAVESDRLAYALESLGGAEGEQDAPRALAAASHTAELARLLERRAAVQVVRLRDDHALSWRQIASALYDDPDRQSSVRRMYDSGRRHLGV